MRTRLPRIQAKRYYSPVARKKYKEQKSKILLPPAPYKSWLEADVAQDLKKNKIPFEYEATRLNYVVPAQVHSYTPDFEMKKNQIIIETKGRWDSGDRKKMGLVIEQHPELDIRMLFALDNKISPRSKTRYSDWCKRRGIKYAIGTSVPTEWREEK